jgi:YesN/AraC family two-component response regulator
VTKHELQDIFQNDDEFRLLLADTNMEDINWFVDRFKSLTERMMSLCQQEQGKSTDVFIQYLLQYMSTNLDADLSLCALSEKVYLNPSYLSRRFKELTGKNIIDTITMMRVSAACRYLEDNKYKISKIAPMVGYESAAHFSRVFKKQIGMTPQEYRDKNAYK